MGGVPASASAVLSSASTPATAEAVPPPSPAKQAAPPAAAAAPPAAAAAPPGMEAPPATRFYTDGTVADMPLWQQVVAALTLLAFIGWIYVLSALMLASPFSRVAALLCLAAWSTILLPVMAVQWRPFMASPLFALWRRYFSFSIVYTQKLCGSQHYLYADFPHGAFPLSQLLGLTIRHRAGWDGEHFYGLAADSVFRIPLWRHVYSWLGIVPASAANLKRHLKWGSVGITPGGIAEMYLAGGSADHIYIRSRKGFVAAAVEEGVPIVPVYHFGNTCLLSFGPRFLEPFGRRWRFSLGVLFGILGLPIPRRSSLMMVVGPPVEVAKLSRADPGFSAAVDDVHRRYMETLQQLYDQHKHTYGWSSHPLIMH